VSAISSNAIIELAVDLASSLTTKDRYDRLLDNVRKLITCDAVALLSFHSGILKPIAIQGLSRDTLGRRFYASEHPRFEILCASLTPVRFPADSPMPDPYDGLLIDRDDDLPVHSCMGLPLYFGHRLLGLLTIDSMTPHMFDDIAERTLQLISSIAAAALNNALLVQQLEAQAAHAQRVVESLTEDALIRDGGELIGNSEVMHALKREIGIAAPSDFTVLIEGETGVGKELVARTLHQKSRRHHAPMVYVNCAALPENLIESELFGHVKGAFTGAERMREGKFLLADGGTLFLDEIGELPLAAQAKMLRVLQSGEVQSLGQDQIKRVDVRVIAATNRDLGLECERGQFRQDLYHRLSVYPINVPMLKDRLGDVPLLVGYFIERLRRKFGLRQLKISNGALTHLSAYSWPGNVRELEHVVSRAALKAFSRQGKDVMVTIDRVDCDVFSQRAFETPIEVTTNSEQEDGENTDLRAATDAFKKQLISRVLIQEKGSWAAAARRLNTNRANLNRLAKRLGVHVVKSVQ